ncbi:MAG TPA: hypothetical protein VMM13_07325 [Euzebya sp.]|nr:hypothetical protein [Euzebya sp.]
MHTRLTAALTVLLIALGVVACDDTVEGLRDDAEDIQEGAGDAVDDLQEAGDDLEGAD